MFLISTRILLHLLMSRLLLRHLHKRSLHRTCRSINPNFIILPCTPIPNLRSSNRSHHLPPFLDRTTYNNNTLNPRKHARSKYKSKSQSPPPQLNPKLNSSPNNPQKANPKDHPKSAAAADPAKPTPSQQGGQLLPRVQNPRNQLVHPSRQRLGGLVVDRARWTLLPSNNNRPNNKRNSSQGWGRV